MSFVFGFVYTGSNYLQPVINDAYLLMALPFILSTLIYIVISAWRSGAEERMLKKKVKQLEQMDPNITK